MEDFLRNIKLIDDFSTTLNISKSEFVSTLRNNVDQADIDGMFSSAFEAFTSSDNMFKGQVDSKGFKIRKRRRFFEKNFGYTKAFGTYRERGDMLIINTKISAWNNFMFFWLCIVIVFYLIFISTLFTSGTSDGVGFVALPFIIIHSLLMLVIPYFMMRKSVKKMKQELEREFFSVIGKINHNR